MLIVFSVFAILSIVIFVHELGHFVAAKLMGIRVVTFCIGMGPRILTKRIGDTFYSIAAIPLGGFVRPLYRYAPGKDPNSTPPRALTFLIRSTEEETRYIESFSHTDKGNYLNASSCARAFFLANGVIFNFLFCIVIMAIQLYQIAPLNRLNSGSYVGAVKEGAYAEGQGLQKGDRLVSVDGVSISSWKDLYDYVKPSAAPLVTATFERIAPEKKEFSIKFDPSLLVMKRYQLERYFLGGFEPASYRLEVTFLQSLYYGTTLTFDILLGLFTKSEEEITADSYFSDKVEKKSEVAAFGLIFPSYELGKESSKSWYDFLVVLVGMNLMAALLNIIPYPAFDGGHLAIILIESVTRQDLNMAWKERLAHFGLATSLLIMVAALGADVVSGLSYITGWLG